MIGLVASFRVLRSFRFNSKIFHIIFQQNLTLILQLNLYKCEFLRKEVSYLGHILKCKEGISPYPRKLEAVKNFPRPKNIKHVRQFLGLSGYYQRFIKNFSQIAKPLSKLPQKEVEFCWAEKEEKVFFKRVSVQSTGSSVS